MTFLPVVCAPALHHGWLPYTVALASRLAGLALPLRLVSPDAAPSSGPALWYGLTPPPGSVAISLPHRPELQPGGMTLLTLECGPAGAQEVLIHAATRDPVSSPSALGFDLLFNLFAYVSCLEEHLHEARHGPIHSYSLRLTGDPRRFDRPYANLLALALRQAIGEICPEALAPMTASPTVVLTHDVDVVHKAPITRAKEGVFRLVNVARRLLGGEWRAAARGVPWALRMIFSRENYFLLEEIAAMEENHGFRSSFNVYARTPPRGFREGWTHLVFDPTYDLTRHPGLLPTLRSLADRGWEIGQHFGFNAWQELATMHSQHEALAAAMAPHPVTSCRQHWLRFSLAATWAAQEQAGITVDETMVFNDRPGFRAGLAAPYHPYDHARQQARPILVLPSMLMDTHLFYYGDLDQAGRHALMRRLLEEVRLVHGLACVIWHTHVFSRDHGWDREYLHLLQEMRTLGMVGLLPGEAATNHRKEPPRP